jgi:hypothetical protein
MKHLLTMAIVVLVGMVGLAAAPVKTLTVVAPATLTCDLNNLFTPADYYRCILYYELKPSTQQRYYLTKGTYKGAQAKNACTPGFHMASLFEILVPSGLMYLQSPSIAATADDAGAGPPTAAGWVRTGGPSNHNSIAIGQANCNSWTSADPTFIGTIVFLSSLWFSSQPPTEPTYYPNAPWWGTGYTTCDTPESTWCVEDLN